jgi:proline-specific peptidase
MLAAQYVTTRLPAGLQKLIICDSPAAIKLWMKTASQLRRALPKDIQETLTKCEEEGSLDSPEWEAATNEFNRRHMCRLDPLPDELAIPFAELAKDDTVCMTMFGPSDYDVKGSLRDWGVEGELKKLTPEVVPGGILLMNGYFDTAQDECMMPFFKEPSAKVKWVTFGLSSHCPQLEETEKFLLALGSFLES